MPAVLVESLLLRAKHLRYGEDFKQKKTQPLSVGFFGIGAEAI